MLSVLLLAASLSATDAKPASEAHVKAALDLITASRTDQSFEQLRNPTEPMVKSTVAQFQGCESAKPVLDEFSKSMAVVKFDDKQIEVVRRDVASVYTEVFSQSELEEMTTFFKSPIGQKMLDRTPEVMQRAMTVSQTSTESTMKKAGEIAQTFGPRLESAYAACAAEAKAAAPAPGQPTGGK
jgi:hypothetical protein